jgi:hypothetical protein
LSLKGEDNRTVREVAMRIKRARGW